MFKDNQKLHENQKDEEKYSFGVFNEEKDKNKIEKLILNLQNKSIPEINLQKKKNMIIKKKIYLTLQIQPLESFTIFDKYKFGDDNNADIEKKLKSYNTRSLNPDNV